MKTSELHHTQKLLDECKRILTEDDAPAEPKKDDEKKEPEAADKKEATVGDAEHPEKDKAKDPAETGNLHQMLGAGMDAMKDNLGKHIGEAVSQAVAASYGKGAKKMVKEYNGMGLKEMGGLASRIDEMAAKIAETLDVKDIIANALGEMIRKTA